MNERHARAVSTPPRRVEALAAAGVRDGRRRRRGDLDPTRTRAWAEPRRPRSPVATPEGVPRRSPPSARGAGDCGGCGPRLPAVGSSAWSMRAVPARSGSDASRSPRSASALGLGADAIGSGAAHQPAGAAALGRRWRGTPWSTSCSSCWPARSPALRRPAERPGAAGARRGTRCCGDAPALTLAATGGGASAAPFAALLARSARARSPRCVPTDGAARRRGGARARPGRPACTRAAWCSTTASAGRARSSMPRRRTRVARDGARVRPRAAVRGSRCPTKRDFRRAARRATARPRRVRRQRRGSTCSR